MYIVPWIVWGVILNYPVYSWDIKAPRSNIRAQQNAGLCIDKFKKRVRTFLLFLFALA